MEKVKKGKVMHSFVISTCKNRKEAEKISDEVLRKKLVACAKMIPINSSYWWKGKIENEKEILLLFQTSKKNVSNLIKHIKKIHSYEVPEIVEIEMKRGNEKFFKWISEVTR